KIDAPAFLRLKGHHQSEEIRVCFNMGRTQARGNPANSDAFPTRLENSNLLKWFWHLIRGSEDYLAAGDLVLMSDTVKDINELVFIHRLLLDGADLSDILGDGVQVVCGRSKRAPLLVIL